MIVSRGGGEGSVGDFNDGSGLTLLEVDMTVVVGVVVASTALA